MRPDSLKLLEDIRLAASRVMSYARGRDFIECSEGEMLRAAVERELITIGEGLNRLSRVDPHTASQITYWREIIAFRNVLVHGYNAIEDDIVWSAVQSDLPELVRQVQALLGDTERGDEQGAR